MDAHRKFWNGQQQALRQALARPQDHQKAIELFLSQHAMLHSAGMSRAGLWSFEDEILDMTSEDQMRRVPAGCEHSIAWIVWHMTRCEDITMNMLAAGNPQVLLRENWLEKMQIKARDTGNAMTMAQVMELGAGMNLEALRAYRLSVGRSTRTVVKQLGPHQMKQKVDPDRLGQVSREGAVVEAAGELLDYWRGLTIAGLLLMPPTRHNFTHWNEARGVRQKFKNTAAVE